MFDEMKITTLEEAMNILDGKVENIIRSALFDSHADVDLARELLIKASTMLINEIADSVIEDLEEEF